MTCSYLFLTEHQIKATQARALIRSSVEEEVGLCVCVSSNIRNTNCTTRHMNPYTVMWFIHTNMTTHFKAQNVKGRKVEMSVLVYSSLYMILWKYWYFMTLNGSCDQNFWKRPIYLFLITFVLWTAYQMDFKQVIFGHGFHYFAKSRF